MISLIAQDNLLCYQVDSERFEYLAAMKQIITAFADKIDIINMNNIPINRTIELMKNKNDLQKSCELVLPDPELIKSLLDLKGNKKRRLWMKSRLPKFLNKRKICIICEGDEEYEYLDRLKALDVWNKQYEIILDNADGNGNIPARYQNGAHDIVLIFCDTDRKPYEQYVDIKRKINEFHGVTTAAEQNKDSNCSMELQKKITRR